MLFRFFFEVEYLSIQIPYRFAQVLYGFLIDVLALFLLFARSEDVLEGIAKTEIVVLGDINDFKTKGRVGVVFWVIDVVVTHTGPFVGLVVPVQGT